MIIQAVLLVTLAVISVFFIYRMVTEKDKSKVGFELAAAIVVVLLILVYVFVGSQAFNTFTQTKVPPLDFFFGSKYNGATTFGISTYIIGSLALVVLGLLIAVPLSLGAAIFITEIAPPWLRNTMRSVVELFLGIPSIIFGLLGLVVLVPIISNILNNIARAATGEFDAGSFYSGLGIIPAALVVTFMIMPTVTTFAIDALQTIPRDLREGSLALGATRWQTIRKTLLPAAIPGVTTGVILGGARILGETVAVKLVIGNAQVVPVTFTNSYPYVNIDATTTITLFLTRFQETLPGESTYNAIWTLAFTLLVISGILVAASRAISSRRVYS